MIYIYIKRTWWLVVVDSDNILGTWWTHPPSTPPWPGWVSPRAAAGAWRIPGSRLRSHAHPRTPTPRNIQRSLNLIALKSLKLFENWLMFNSVTSGNFLCLTSNQLITKFQFSQSTSIISIVDIYNLWLYQLMNVRLWIDLAINLPLSLTYQIIHKSHFSSGDSIDQMIIVIFA